MAAGGDRLCDQRAVGVGRSADVDEVRPLFLEQRRGVAVGAQRRNVLWLVLRETLTLALLGIAIGIPSALAATRLIARMLFGLSPTDFPTIAAVSLLLLLVALFAGYLPARRASAVWELSPL